MHGGKTPRGIASPSFKHGRYSQDLPARLQESYRQALEDDQRLALEDEIAVVDARLRDLLARVDTGEAGLVWRRLQDTFADFTAANRANDREEMAAALNELGRLIGRGNADYAAWHEVNNMLALRMRLTESERKRIMEAQQFVTVDKLMVYTAAVSDAIKQAVTRNITDTRLRSIILADAADELRRLLTRGDSRPMGSSS